MTIHEARIYAGGIWGHERIVRLGLRPDGGVDVELTPIRLLGSRERGGRPQTFSYHRLDNEGHPLCHDACAAVCPS